MSDNLGGLGCSYYDNGEGRERPGEGAGAAWRGLKRELLCGLVCDLNEEPRAVLTALFASTDPRGPGSGSLCRVMGTSSWGRVHGDVFMGGTPDSIGGGPCQVRVGDVDLVAWIL